MTQSYQGSIDENGNIRLDKSAMIDSLETALLSEKALAEDWNRPEEDAAWAHLQPTVVK
jgi:hypothetical protein